MSERKVRVRIVRTKQGNGGESGIRGYLLATDNASLRTIRSRPARPDELTSVPYSPRTYATAGSLSFGPVTASAASIMRSGPTCSRLRSCHASRSSTR
jgi:hypothetical protein